MILLGKAGGVSRVWHGCLDACLFPTCLLLAGKIHQIATCVHVSLKKSLHNGEKSGLHWPMAIPRVAVKQTLGGKHMWVNHVPKQ